MRIEWYLFTWVILRMVFFLDKYKNAHDSLWESVDHYHE